MKMSGNKIWLEFEEPENEAHAAEQCRLANNMLRRLATATSTGEWGFSYDNETRMYRYGSESAGYIEMPERRHWLSLDFLGRDFPTEQQIKAEMLDDLAL